MSNAAFVILGLIVGVALLAAIVTVVVHFVDRGKR
jgi:hypothetical protein